MSVPLTLLGLFEREPGSGSGKSTLLHCLAWVLVPDGEQVLRFGGRCIDSTAEAQP